MFKREYRGYCTAHVLEYVKNFSIFRDIIDVGESIKAMYV